MAINYAELLPEILPELPGISQPIVINAIRNATRYFCEESTVWRYELPLMTTGSTTGAKEYILSTPDGTQIISVLPPVEHNGISVVNRTLNDLNRNEVKWREMNGVQAQWYVMLKADVLLLVPYQIKSVSKALRVSVVLKPTRDSVSFDDWVYSEYGETIACIAKYMLMLMPNKEWTDRGMAVFYKDKSDEVIVEALSRITSGFTKGTVDRNNKVQGVYF